MKGSIHSHHRAHQAEVHMQMYRRGMCATEVEECLRRSSRVAKGGRRNCFSALVTLTSSTSDLGDGGASTDHKHQQQCNTVPLALQGVE